MNTSVNNSTAKFLESFIKLGEFFEDALNNCLNENYNDVDSVDSKEDDRIEEPTDCCCGKGCDCCEDCSNSEEKTPGVPASSTIKCDEYTLIISDYSVKLYEDALKVMAPKLNQMTFNMRICNYGQITLEFRFSGLSYTFTWDKDLDKFIGVQNTALSTKEVYWDEIEEQVKDLTLAKRKELQEDLSKNDVNTQELEEDTDKESQSATYAADGNAIKEEEIPSLKDYTRSNKDYTTSEEPSVGNTFITGTILYNKLNNDFSISEEHVIKSALVGVENILMSDEYETVASEKDGNINKIKFTINQIIDNMPEALPKDLRLMVHLHTLARAIEERFEFAHVEIKNDTVYCNLI